MMNIAKRRASELRALAARLLQVANDMEREQAFDAEPVQRKSLYGERWGEVDADLMLIKASEIYRARRRRKRFFGPELFGEPAWDLLLDLFIARLKKKRVSVTSACYAADVPPTTALRWLGLLADSNLIERFESETDQRVTWVRLTDYASQKMLQCIGDMSVNSLEMSGSLDRYLIDDPAEVLRP